MTPRIRILDGGPEEAWEAGFNARNYLLKGIFIFSRIEAPAAILAQELYEWRFKVRRQMVRLALTIAVTAAAMLLLDPVAGLVGLPVFALGGIWARLNRESELTSHMIETLAAVDFYGRDFDDYLTREAAGMVGAYSHLKGMSAQDIREGMLGKRKQAQSWLDSHRGFIREWQEKLGR